ncbi:unnamed protein product [Trichobilharzia szidati]|nr:unnamed protein product [Trichobilharzia szidati]CAH8842713.1 unnamed protein product [Trichobilharzia szidati]
MLSAKLRLLRGLAPVSFDDSILYCSTLPNNNKCEASKSAQPSYVNLGKSFPQHFQQSQLHEVYLPTFSSTVGKSAVNHFVTSNGPTVVSNPTNKCVEKKNQSCQTESLESEVCIESLSTTISQIFHKLNRHELKNMSNCERTQFPKLWLDLSELNYSPAQYNLGVWYEIQASKCLPLHDNLKRHYTNQASYWYRCAVRKDSHPLAAYNLACLMLNSHQSAFITIDCTDKRKGEEQEEEKEDYTVIDLMKLAADGNVKQAKKYLSKHTL